MRKLTVKLGKRSYPILTGVQLAGLGAELRKLKTSKKLLVVTDANVARHYLSGFVSSLKRSGFVVTSAVLSPGEKNKNLDSVKRIYARAVASGLDRRSAIIALGGGVVGDTAGFAAATYMRGIPFIQVPTTLLAMVDSSVGGKTGVDLKEGKNLVGAFHQPKLVWIDTGTLGTLHPREIRNGLAEVIKCGVIADAGFFRYLEKNISRLSPKVFGRMIFKSCAIKAKVVEKDEFEQKGVREILNFGHTFGHAIETLTGYGRVLHGEAVAAGMLVACALALKLKLAPAKILSRVLDVVIKAGLSVALPKGVTAEKMVKTMMRDKKTRGGLLRLVLPTRIGKVAVKTNIPIKKIYEVLK
ncbi:MAG: 3-dehydroquinate synthase [Endomicrobiales bacterium]|nr:3-dehydroquinate synthase [Endomicrobiales bacterium]